MPKQTDKPRYRKSVKLTIVNCKSCPNCKTRLTKGYGYAQDFYCIATLGSRVIAGYVEWQSEEPKDNQIPT